MNHHGLWVGSRFLRLDAVERALVYDLQIEQADKTFTAVPCVELYFASGMQSFRGDDADAVIAALKQMVPKESA